jgi:hypothetical protein
MWLGNKSNDKLLEHGSRALGFVDRELLGQLKSNRLYGNDASKYKLYAERN